MPQDTLKIEIEGIQQPYSIEEDHPLVNYMKEAMRKVHVKPIIKGSEGATTITFFQNKNIPAIATGFGAQGCAHIADEYAKIDNLYKESTKTKSLSKFLDRISNGLERYAFQVGKDAVGISAVAQASHAISQKIGLNYTFFDPNEISQRLQFNFKLNKSTLPNGKIIYSLSSVLSQDHKVISQVLSGFINAYVDIAKDPYIIRINGGITSSSAYLTAIRLGMPLSTVVRWFNQPIIREYIALKEKNKSILSDVSESKLLPWEVVDNLIQKYGGKPLEKTDEYTDKELEGFITEWVEANKPSDIRSLSEEFKINQVNLLLQFRELEKVSQELFNFYQGISYDTARTASHESFRIKFAQTRKALNGLFSSFVTKAIKDTFVGAIFDTKLQYLQATRQFYLSENDYARQVLNPLLLDIFNTVGKKADIEKAAMDMRRHFITYLLQTLQITHNGKTFVLTDLIDDLILGDRNIVKRLKTVQKQQKEGNLQPNIFIKYLQGVIPTVLFKNKGDQSPIHSTRLVSKPKDKLQQDLFTDAINQLNQSDDLHNFVNDLILSQLLQSGVIITPLSFSEIIPNEVFQSLSSQIKNYFDTTNPTDILFNFQDSYLRNKWKDKNIVLAARKTNPKSGTKYLKPIFRAFSTNFLIYPVTNEDRSYMAIPKESKYKYVKIRTQKEKLSEFEQMDKKAAGDFSNIETIIYKRFETINPSTGLLDVPLVAEMDKRGNLHFKVLFYPSDKYGNGIYAAEHYSSSQPSKYFKPVSKTPNTYQKIKEAIENPENQSIVTISDYWLSDFKPQVQQNEDVEDINLDEFEESLLYLPQMIEQEGITATEEQTQETNIPSTEVKNDIYSQLGNKTVSNNVQIKSVYQQEGIQYAKSIGGVFSLRVNNSEKHFGNPFSSVPAEIAKGLIATKSTKESVEKYIDWVINSKEERAKWVREQLKSGILKGKPIVYYKELGEPSHATALDYLINKYDWNKNINTEVNNSKADSFKKINIYAGTNENAELSNFAIRPFKIVGETYKTVEAAFQAAKSNYAPSTQENLNIVKKLQSDISGAQAKSLGRKIKGLETNKWDKDSSGIMKELLLESFKQNPKALETLLVTGNATLTHTQDKGKWGKEFPKLLMEVRSELSNQSTEVKPLENPDYEPNNDPTCPF
jgi:ribA/ribD-fused uncharacterized protein